MKYSSCHECRGGGAAAVVDPSAITRTAGTLRKRYLTGEPKMPPESILRALGSLVDVLDQIPGLRARGLLQEDHKVPSFGARLGGRPVVTDDEEDGVMSNAEGCSASTQCTRPPAKAVRQELGRERLPESPFDVTDTASGDKFLQVVGVDKGAPRFRSLACGSLDSVVSCAETSFVADDVELVDSCVYRCLPAREPVPRPGGADDEVAQALILLRNVALDVIRKPIADLIPA